MSETPAGSSRRGCACGRVLVVLLVATACRGFEPAALAQESKYVVAPCDQVYAAPDVELPDLALFEPAAVRRGLPSGSDGVAGLIAADGDDFLEESLQSNRRADLVERQGTEDLRALAAQSGTLTLSELIAQVNDPLVASSEAGVATLRLPLLIQPGATLVVNGSNTRELRLSTGDGAFVINAGTLWVVDSLVTSWDEDSGAATPLSDPKHFRPYLASHIRSHTVLLDSVFQDLGYAAPTSYGISLSSEPERERGGVNDDWPTGVLVGNEFRRLFYGFYSYEARDVAIVGNRYRDCVKYGIDPHDRSTRLIIAQNNVSGTVERHGIIGSRGVSDSFIFANESHRNAGSGIMLDRECTGNVVVDNRAYLNNQGVAVYESSDNVIAGNMIVGNKKSGVRIRNSRRVFVQDNTCVSNGDYAFEVSEKRLDDHDKRAARGDTYEQATTATISGNRLAANRGYLKTNGLTRLTLGPILTVQDAAAVEELTGTPVTPEEVPATLKVGGDAKPLADRLQAVGDSVSSCVVLELSADASN
ncbi:MAG: right-handed parallel beta-helix repeat-containing protein [Planctomycetota bacterium]